ncbi:MAG: threonine/serine exporter [Desulforhopalus sp.]|nr:threonine/serine exporter [Desulforhopalus sp.]
MNSITYDEQVKATHAIIEATLLMLECGAESVLIEQTSQRLGKALHIESVELALLSSAVALTTFTNNQSQSVSLIRRAHDKPINMSVVCDIQRMIRNVEQNKLSVDLVIETIKDIQPKQYNRWLVVFMVGLSCGCFSRLHGGDPSAFIATFFAAGLGMFVRQELSRRKFSAFLTFCLTPFIVTLIASISQQIWPLSSTPDIILVSAVLFLVPGFPFVNSFLDAIEGYMVMAWGRWLHASLLVVATAIGIIMAMNTLNLNTW